MGCRRCRTCARQCGCGQRRGEIHWTESPEIRGVYYACRRELLRNADAEEGSNIILLHFRAEEGDEESE